ncbi:hypothetical protein FRACYDRAFT_244986 [Fragilariopsis cylindrus CCMP1102]|uniref:Uncharacterized protein n=1 Tax=Fragilariopsis cylindrus CCMP1102 TaxID=635003 RepID=A0A1E7F170_9STRA|nr:hypothetical protein FRACYDRAFT_244986 [Fragilariopsis cylindrus CCMP1102]|eukprot:OEU11866.1 hypothetical protein FRACYDRAFT_244986 [Fragilariopsis cylindrus CCMP1102]
MCRTINTAVSSCSLLCRCTKNYYVRSLTLCLLMILLLLVEQEGSEAFFVTPSSSSCSSQRRHNQHRHIRFMHPPSNNKGKGSPSFGRLESSYKRVKVDPPKDLKVMTPDEVAESLETILKEQRNDACEQAYIGSLDAWMVASNKAKIKKGEDNQGKNNDSSRVVEYGKRMEDVLTLMETNCASGTTIDAYATVIHLYVCGKESYAALRVLRRMENQLLIQQEQQQAGSSTITGGGDDSEWQNNNFKLRRIQYNRVLQGLISTSDTSPLHLRTAIQLLMSMSLQEEFVYPTPAGFMEPSFSPTNITPDAKSFAIVLVAMIMTQEEGDDVKDDDELVVTLIDQAKKLDQMNDFLLKKIDRAMVSSSDNNKERFNTIKQRISLPN